MCRLFALCTRPASGRATFWLDRAPDSLLVQSRREPDGTGLGYFTADGGPRVEKAPVPAWRDRAFLRGSRDVESDAFIAHLRFASTGARTEANTHPFLQDGRIFAHNGVIEDLPALEQRLGPALELVRGDTDSERFFALITAETRTAGSLSEGIRRAVEWLAATLPVLSLNFVLADAHHVWAFRYPDTHGLYVLDRVAGGPHGNRPARHRGPSGGIAVESAALAHRPAVVVASEPMDDDPGWRLLDSGELLRIDRGPTVVSSTLLTTPPARPLRLADLEPEAAASQRAG